MYIAENIYLPCSCPSLPVELLLAIFTFLTESNREGKHRYDQKTLLSCSVVSHLWRDLALPYLFPRVSLRLRPGNYATRGTVDKIQCCDRSAYEVTASFIQCKNASRHETPDSVIQFLALRPSICRCIRTLKLTSPGRLLMSSPALLAILRLLPALSYLALDGITLAPPSVARLVSAGMSRQKLRLQKLHIRAEHAESTRAFFDLLRLFDSVHELRLGGPNELLVRPHDGALLPRVHTVRMGQCSDHGIQVFRKLLEAAPAVTQHLCALHVEDIVTRTGVENLAQILATVGPRLEHLDVDLETLARISPEWHGLNLSPCRALRTLALSLRFDFAHLGIDYSYDLAPQNAAMWRGLARLLRTAHAGMEALVLSLNVVYAIDWDPAGAGVGFSEVEDELVRFVRAGLRVVRVRLRHSQGQEARMWADVVERLPRVEEEGALELVEW